MIKFRSLNNFFPVAKHVRCHQKTTTPKSKETPLLKQLAAKIRLTGPITVADYMKEVLANPLQGYYTSKDVFGPKGDFVTSPEISQIFGELIAIWFLHEWKKMGLCKPLNIVELGPGRGTLAKDMIRVFARFPDLSGHLRFHLVETSPHLCSMQQSLLCKVDGKASTKPGEGSTCYGIPVHWHSDFKDVPAGFTCVVANEFFDALPIHKFVKKEDEWKEVLIDVDFGNGPHHLMYVLSNNPTPASKLFISEKESKDQVEVCPKAGIAISDVCKRITECGGCALICDYGYCGDKGDTFRAFKNHSLHDPLCEPGTADLTACVDFSYFNKIVSQHAISFGPVSQEKFLRSLGIEIRLQKLMKTADPDERKNLKSSFEMLMDPCEMGRKFHFYGIFPRVMKDFLTKFPPTGFRS